MSSELLLLVASFSLLFFLPHAFFCIQGYGFEPLPNSSWIMAHVAITCCSDGDFRVPEVKKEEALKLSPAFFFSLFFLSLLFHVGKAIEVGEGRGGERRTNKRTLICSSINKSFG